MVVPCLSVRFADGTVRDLLCLQAGDVVTGDLWVCVGANVNGRGILLLLLSSSWALLLSSMLL